MLRSFAFHAIPQQKNDSLKFLSVGTRVQGKWDYLGCLDDARLMSYDPLESNFFWYC